MANEHQAESRLKLSDSIFNVIYNYIDTGSGSADELMNARLTAEDIATSILEEIVIDIAPEADENGNIVVVLRSYSE